MDVVICVEFRMKYRCTEFGLPLVGGFGEDIVGNCVEMGFIFVEFGGRC